MQKILSGWSAFFYQLATPRNVLLALAAQLLFSGIIFPVAQVKFDLTGAGVPDLQFGLTPEKLYAIFEAYGEKGRQFYFWAEIFADGLYPLVYTGFGILILSLLLRKLQLQTSCWHLLNLWPLLILVADYLENTFILIALWHFPERCDGVARMASIAQWSKWTTFGLGFLILLTLTALLVRRRL